MLTKNIVLEEYRSIRPLCKAILPKPLFKKADRLKDPIERTEGLKYLVTSQTKLKFLHCESQIEKVNKGKNLLLESKLKLLHSKIGIFLSTFSKRDYVVIEKITQEIETEVAKCLAS